MRSPGSSNDSRAAGVPIRCAIYTRKSTEEGLEQAFNSLDAQRERVLPISPASATKAGCRHPSCTTTAGSRAATWSARDSGS